MQRQKDFQKDQPENWEGIVLDWWGNNVALKCPCGQVYIVSRFLGKGKRKCPKCGKSEGIEHKAESVSFVRAD
jgi:hypothetical protein